jgi:hypothetical protein
MYDLVYAKRCMHVLLAKTPRQTPVAVWKGERWVVDWSSGKVEKYRPAAREEAGSRAPSYERVVGGTV